MNLELLKVINGLQIQSEFEYDFGLKKSFLESIECVSATDISVFGNVKKIGKRYELTLSYSGDLVFGCHRCLKEVNINLKNTVERVLVTTLETEVNEDANKPIPHSHANKAVIGFILNVHGFFFYLI